MERVKYGCHDVLMISMSLSNTAILNINGADYCCIINGISKNVAISLLQNADVTEKKWNIVKDDSSLLCIKDG